MSASVSSSDSERITENAVLAVHAFAPTPFTTKTWNEFRHKNPDVPVIDSELYTFEHADLSAYTVKRADISGYIKSNFTKCNLQDISFCHAKLKKAVFAGATLTNVNFNDADLSGADFSGTIFNNVNFIGAILTDAIFNNAELYNVKFTGAI